MGSQINRCHCALSDNNVGILYEKDNARLVAGNLQSRTAVIKALLRVA